MKTQVIQQLDLAQDEHKGNFSFNTYSFYLLFKICTNSFFSY
jgi:hypothetical protein